ncbi:MAG: TonB-dependent receptor [Chitinophagaceae bacterium]|nr:TonB-dependent receptor [Chitinophagaceae bacterium]
MKKIIFLFLATTCVASIYAQTESDTTKEVSLRTVLISNNKFPEKKKNVVQPIEVITKKDMKRMNAQSIADVLINTGNVFVQKSQQGGGSPVLRGFEASRLVLSVDGIRLNNAIYRAGHLQNIITVDQNALDKVEVMYGPSSVAHGSDALGGAILMKTREVRFGRKKNVELLGANALVRYSSVNTEKTGSVGINFGNNKFGSVTQLTYTDFGDMVQGKNGVDSIMNLWKKNFVVDRIDGKDTMLENADPYKQVSTAYHQMDVLQKFSFKQNNQLKHTLNLQLSNSSNIPRYDRLTETSNGIAKSAEWYYGPQFRTLAAYTMDINNLQGFIQDVVFTLSHQWVKESRHNRNFKSNNLNHREEDIKVIAYTLAARHKTDEHELTIGTDGQFNNLKSVGTQTNIATDIEKKIDSRYPDGKNNMNLLGVYLQHTWKLMDEKVVINDGIRFDYNTLKSTLVDTSIMFKLPFQTLEQKNTALTGNIGVAYMPEKELRFIANISRGFRCPNFDDMTKVFGSKAGSGLIVPNTELKPEYTRTLDLGMQFNNGLIEMNVNGFYTNYTNAIVTDKFQYNGQDSVVYDGVLTPVFASVNKAKAFVYGGGLQVVYHPIRNFSISASSNYTYGRFNDDTVLVPLDHIAPVHGRFGTRYDASDWYTELYCLYNGKKKISDYNPDGEDNLPYATPNGMPGWYTINWRMGITVAKYVQLQLGVENILDKNYRYFASGMSAPGRNAVVAVRLNY